MLFRHGHDTGFIAVQLDLVDTLRSEDLQPLGHRARQGRFAAISDLEVQTIAGKVHLWCRSPQQSRLTCKEG